MLTPSNSNSATGLILVDGKTRRRISFTDILFIQSEHIYVRLYLRDGSKVLHRGALRDLFRQLPTRFFLQIHRSYIINLHAVSKYRGGVLTIGGEAIPVSRTYRKVLREVLNNPPQVTIPYHASDRGGSSLRAI